MIFYSFYNAQLIQSATNIEETVLSFINDSMLLVTSKSLLEVDIAIRDIMEHPNRGFDWSITHNSPYELTKLALMNYSCSLLDTAPSDLVLTRTNSDRSKTSQTIKTTNNYKCLGVMLEPKVRWSSHHQKVITNAT